MATEPKVDWVERTVNWTAVLSWTAILIWTFAPELLSVLRYLGHLFVEKWFDIVLAFAGTLLGYRLAKRHLEHFVTRMVKSLDDKYSAMVESLDQKHSTLIADLEQKNLIINRDAAFLRAVHQMLPEIPHFYLRANAFGPNVVAAITEFETWQKALDPTHTPEKSMEVIGLEAQRVAEQLIQKDWAFREEKSIPNFDWQIGITGVPTGAVAEESPDLTIYDWNTGLPVYQHALMQEASRTKTSRTTETINYHWTWDMTHALCGVYVGVVNFRIGTRIQTGGVIGDRVRVYFKRDGEGLIKAWEFVPWEKP